MRLPGQTGHAAEALCSRVFRSSVHSVCLFVTKVENVIFLKTCELILMQVDTSGPRVNGMIQLTTLGVRRSRSHSHEAENRFGGLAEASFSTL